MKTARLPPTLTLAQWKLIERACDRQIAVCCVIARANGHSFELDRTRDDYIDIVAEIDRKLNGGDPP